MLFIEVSISPSFRSTRDCAEIAACAAAEATSEPTMADKNATWEVGKHFQLLKFLPQLFNTSKVNNNMSIQYKEADETSLPPADQCKTFVCTVHT